MLVLYSCQVYIENDFEEMLWTPCISLLCIKAEQLISGIQKSLFIRFNATLETVSYIFQFLVDV